ncbi:hypothetical protein [Novosphingopyxis iocasae]|nr:hypothetical protein [Novosphingopyxis iocasae]|tara:strand:- start:237 stop:383 length:147 start_codon:yes stop_codon:yes gene_type:complete
METAIDRIWDGLAIRDERAKATPARDRRRIRLEADDAAILAHLFSLKA